MVAHMLTRSTAAGRSNSVAFSTAGPASPSKMKPNTRPWRSRIHDIPDHIQLHSWVSIQLHCSGWAVTRVDCIRVAPPAIRRKRDGCLQGVEVRGGEGKPRAVGGTVWQKAVTRLRSAELHLVRRGLSHSL